MESRRYDDFPLVRSGGTEFKTLRTMVVLGLIDETIGRAGEAGLR